MIWTFLLAALIIGALLPVQAGINAQLRIRVGQPIIAAAIQFVVGTLALFIACVGLRVSWPDVSKLQSAPWWLWAGGIVGASYILIAIILAPKLGAATLIGVSVAGQMIASLVLDHYGLIGYPIHPISAWRVVGTGLLVAGVALIQRF